MKREKVVELATRAGFEISGKDAWMSEYLITPTIVEFARLVELETLERAAVVCDTDPFGSKVCGDLIRNLKETHDKE